jgi:hypothetical protein
MPWKSAKTEKWEFLAHNYETWQLQTSTAKFLYLERKKTNFFNIFISLSHRLCSHLTIVTFLTPQSSHFIKISEISMKLDFSETIMHQIYNDIPKKNSLAYKFTKSHTITQHNTFSSHILSLLHSPYTCSKKNYFGEIISPF